MGIFKGYAVAGCAPDEMGIGPVHAVPKLLSRSGLTVDDIDLLGDQRSVCVCPAVRDARVRDRSCEGKCEWWFIAIGHPFGMTGARQVGHILLEGQRRKAKHVVVSVSSVSTSVMKAR